MLNDGESSAYTEEENEMEAGLGHTHTFGGSERRRWTEQEQ
jgi:hypothetical protein